MSFISRTLFLAAKLRQGRYNRGGIMLFISLFLGVASVAAIGSFAASVMAGMRQEGAAILGGDIKITLNQRHFSEDEKKMAAKSCARDEFWGLNPHHDYVAKPHRHGRYDLG